MEDLLGREEKYTPPPPPPYTAYSGDGASLGGAEGVGLEVNTNAEKPKFDESKPFTTI